MRLTTATVQRISPRTTRHAWLEWNYRPLQHSRHRTQNKVGHEVNVLKTDCSLQAHRSCHRNHQIHHSMRTLRRHTDQCCNTAADLHDTLQHMKQGKAEYRPIVNRQVLGPAHTAAVYLNNVSTQDGTWCCFRVARFYFDKLQLPLWQPVSVTLHTCITLCIFFWGK